MKKNQVRTQKKKYAFKDNVKQMIDATKNALKKSTQKSCLADDNDDLEECDGAQKKNSSKNSSSEAQISFFYTNDKYFTQLDDNEIIMTIKEKYPAFMEDNASDADLKQIIVTILQDKDFILSLLEFYNLSIQDFFKFMFRRDIAIFKGPYLTKLQKIIAQNGYN